MPSRSRSRTRERSRSRSRSRRSSRSRSRSRRSRSRSRSRGGGGGGGRRGYSPMSSRRRHLGNRDDPTPSRCLGIFGLSLYTTEKELEKEFGRFGPMEKVQVVLDGHSGRSRGFAFIYYEDIEDATEARNKMTGTDLDGKKIRVDFSITKRAHTPTPGMYMGRPTQGSSNRRGSSRDRDSRRSKSPYRSGGGGGRRSYRSRSRSNSRGGGGGRRDYSPPPRRDYSPQQRRRERSYSPRRY